MSLSYKFFCSDFSPIVLIFAFVLLNYLGDSSIFGSNDSDRNDTESSEPFQNVTEMQESQGTYSG